MNDLDTFLTLHFSFIANTRAQRATRVAPEGHELILAVSGPFAR